MPRKGQKLSEEAKKKLSESRKHLTPEQKEHMAAAQRGKRVSEETRTKMSNSHIGHIVSTEVRQAIGNAHRGKVVSEASKELNRQAHLGKKDSPEVREKKRLAHLGELNAFFGMHHTPETLAKITGRPKTEEHRQHLSESKKGIIPPNINILKTSRIGAENSEYQKQRVSEALTGIKRSPETIELNRIAHTGLVQSPEAREKNRLANLGEKNPAWKGGITPFYESIRSSAKYLEWRDAVYKRDDYTDVITLEKGNGNLNAHHIKPFAEIMKEHNITTFEQAMACEELWDVSNGITMIDVNHARYHSATGKPE